MYDFARQYQIDDCFIHLENHKIYLIQEGKYGTMSKIRLPISVAIILNSFDGQRSVKDIIQMLSSIFSLNYSEAEEAVFKVINRFQHNLTLDKNNSKVKTLPLQILLKEFVPYRAEDFEFTRENSPKKEIVYMASPLCGFSCVYCYANMSYEKKELHYLPLVRWKNIMEEGKKHECKTVFFSGGDPLLNPHIKSYISIASDNDFQTTLSTKRYISPTEMHSLKNHGLNYLQISLDSSDKYIVAQMTGVGDAYEQAIGTIKNAKDQGILIRSKSVITGYNIKQIPQLIELLCELNIDEVSLNHYTASAGRFCNSLYPTVDELDALDCAVSQLQEKYGKGKIRYEFGQSRFLKVGRNDLNMQRKLCAACKDTIIINYDGKVYFCEYLMDDERFIVGDLCISGLMDVWNSNSLKSWFKPDRKKFFNTKCYDCKIFEGCFPRRCYLRSRIAYQNPFQIDPWCPYSDFTEIIV